MIDFDFFKKLLPQMWLTAIPAAEHGGNVSVEFISQRCIAAPILWAQVDFLHG
jgi:hypothetical protein